jgi:hypothetical protein
MKFYRVHNAGGFSWHRTKHSAERYARRYNFENQNEMPCDIMPVEIKLNKLGILSLLNRFARH